MKIMHTNDETMKMIYPYVATSWHSFDDVGPFDIYQAENSS